MQMEQVWYEIACQGDMKGIEKIRHHKQQQQQLHLHTTPNKNTILHVHLAFSDHPSINFVEQLVKICPQLLTEINDYNETPLHIAAKEGYVDVVEALLKLAKAQHPDLECGLVAVKQMLRMTDRNGNTALHEVAKNHNSSVCMVKLLISEDIEFWYDSVNSSGETPLYIAVSRSSFAVVSEMLEISASLPIKGPAGMTILHAAVRRNDPDITRKILETDKNNIWTKETDENGWTPLHYAAYYGHHPIVKLLVMFDPSASMIPDKQRKMTALHLAAGQGYFRITDTIMSSCPACTELVDDRGWNYAHFSMCSITTPYAVRNQDWNHYLLNQEDVRGNTPPLVLAAISQNAFDDVEKRLGSEFTANTKQRIHNGEEQFRHLKNEVSELSKAQDEPYRNGVIQLRYIDGFETWSSFEKNRDMYLLVNVLIATVTFTAGLTVPGGYVQEGLDKGTPILIRNAAFKTFVISDTVALVLSMSAVLFHFLWQIQKLKKKQEMIKYAHHFTKYALMAMIVAYVTGTYATLKTSLGLAIANVVVGLSFFVIIIEWAVRSMRAKHE